MGRMSRKMLRITTDWKRVVVAHGYQAIVWPLWRSHCSEDQKGIARRDYSLPDPALPAVSVTALVPHHSHCEPFDGERTVHHLELVGAVAYQPFRDQGHE